MLCSVLNQCKGIKNLKIRYHVTEINGVLITVNNRLNALVR